jgi:PPK2 family polyphosphate:nucleotide phosphotransferase
MSQPIQIRSPIRLRDFSPDFHDGLDKEEAREKAAHYAERIGELQEILNADASKALLIVLQGMDTSGKDGAIKHVLQSVNPAGVQTSNFKAPSTEELQHDFLWRVHKVVPRLGDIGVFNRSHYEEVLIVRVLKLKRVQVWRARYDQINAFENYLVGNGIVILKFFLHISREEQAERLRARIMDPSKNWKFKSDDLKMRAHWGKFQKAYEDAINYCSTPYAPWHIVPANRKWYRDYIVSKTVLKALENMNLKYPKAEEDLSKIRIK